LSEIKWIKFDTGMFDDAKIKKIRSMPDGDRLLLVWIYLLLQAGVCNAGGYIFITKDVPLTAADISNNSSIELNTVKLALGSFQKFGMIEIEDDEKIYITNFSKHQSLEGMERIREQNRLRQRRFREEKKLQYSGNVTTSVTNNARNGTDKNRIDKSKDKNSKYVPLAQLLYSEHKKNDDGFLAGKDLEKTFYRWANDIRLLVENDKRDFKLVESVIKWCQSPGCFWVPNILSGSKLRIKFPTLVSQFKRLDKTPKTHDNNWSQKHGSNLSDYIEEL
jgi:predicted phage replisome organizer